MNNQKIENYVHYQYSSKQIILNLEKTLMLILPHAIYIGDAWIKYMK
jgi:hypothetical protein